MPSATTSTTTTLHSKPTHIPKLTYRNAAPTYSRDDSAGSISTLSSVRTSDSAPPTRPPYISKLSFRNGLSYTPRESTSTLSTSASSMTVSTPPSSPGLSEHQYTGTSLSDEPPAGASSGSPEKRTKTGKKKGGSLFNFFALKEPSTQAFAEFQEQARRQAAAKNGRPTAVGLPGVSSAKLPPTVPKVNSKWNGVPETAKDKHKRKSSSQGPTGINGLAGGPPRRSTSTVNSDSTRTRSGTTLSNGSNGSGQLSGNGMTLRTGSAGANSSDLSLSRRHAPSPNSQSLKSPSTASLPTMTSFFPPEIPQKYLNDVPSVERHRPSLGQGPMTRVPLNTEARNHINDSASMKLSEPLPPFPTEVVLKSSGAGVLGPPMTTKRKLKVHAFPAGEAEPVKTPESEVSSPILEQQSLPTPPPPLASYSVNSYPSQASDPLSRSDIAVKHPKPARPKLERGLSSRCQDSTLWEFEAPKPEVQNHVQSTPQPVHQSGRGSFRKSMKSVFSK